MKKLLLALFIPLASCSSNHSPENKQQVFIIPDDSRQGSIREATFITIDGCEYIISGSGNSFAMTHKGNCKNHSADTVYIPVPSENHSEIK